MAGRQGASETHLSYFDNMCQKDHPLVWVATISEDGKPHLVPTCFVRPIAQDKVAVGCVFIRQTLANVRRNKHVALASAARLADGYDGYMIKGTAEVIRSGETFERVKKAVYESTNGRRTIIGALVISVDRLYSLKPATGKKRIK